MSVSKADCLSELNSLIDSTWKIYIDTCSLYEATKTDFWDRLIPVLQRNRCPFVITKATFMEIKKHRYDESRSDLAEVEQRLEERLLPLGRNGLDLMKIIDDNGSFHDNVIQAKIRELALTHNQVYITNDLGSAWDVYNGIKNSRSVDRDLKELRIYKIKKNSLLTYDQLEYLNELNQSELDHYFELWAEKKHGEATKYLSANTSFNKKTKQLNGQIAAAFNKALQTADVEAEAISFAMEITLNPSAQPPKKGDVLYALHGQRVETIELGDRRARGGEGVVYSVAGAESDRLAKVYKRSKMSKNPEKAKQTMDKICYIVSRGIGSLPGVEAATHVRDYVKFPTHVLVNENREFVGYLMEEAQGIQLSEFIADGSVQEVFASKYPSVTKLSLIEICKNLLSALESLHVHGILVGDLNANNILVDTDTCEVTLIDADSYQYRNAFPCNVGVEKYTSPEFLIGRESNFRTLQNELFVVARLLCEVLMMVDNPYNSKVATDPVKDMVEGRFRFTFEFPGGESRLNNSEAPNEELKTRWGQLSKALKDSFGNTFHKNGAHWKEGDRLETPHWRGCLERYEGEIRASIAHEDDIVSNEVFPKEKRKWVTKFSCKVCGGQGTHSPEDFQEIIDIPHDKISDIAKNYHFDCYCEEMGYSDLVCSKCNTETGWYGLAEDHEELICVLCQLPGSCSKCGWSNDGRLKRWMLLENEGLCKRCFDREYAKCNGCGKTISKPPAGRNAVCGECRNKLRTKYSASSIFGAKAGNLDRNNTASETYKKCRRCGTAVRGNSRDGFCFSCYNVKRRERDQAQYDSMSPPRGF